MQFTTRSHWTHVPLSHVCAYQPRLISWDRNRLLPVSGTQGQVPCTHEIKSKHLWCPPRLKGCSRAFKCCATLQADGRLKADVSAVSDGPDLFAFRHVSNLGAIQDSLKGEPNEADLKAMQGVPNRGTVFEGIYIDGPAIFGSSVLLVVLLLLLFNQVFGLDRLLDRAKAKRKEDEADKEKWAIYNARQQLERSMSSIDENDQSQS